MPGNDWLALRDAIREHDAAFKALWQRHANEQAALVARHPDWGIWELCVWDGYEVACLHKKGETELRMALFRDGRVLAETVTAELPGCATHLREMAWDWMREVREHDV